MFRSRRLRTAIGLVFVLACLAEAPEARRRVQSPDALLRKSDVGGFVPVTCRVRLVMKQGNGTSEVELWRSGADRTLVRFLDPKERGKYLLRLGADLWFIAPGAKNPVHLSPSHRVYGAATIDVLLGMHLADDYRIIGTSRQATAGGAHVVFDLQAKSAQPGDRESVKMADQARLGFEAVISSQSFLTTRWNYPKKMVALFYPPV